MWAHIIYAKLETHKLLAIARILTQDSFEAKEK